jgi:hypothetical protein
MRDPVERMACFVREQKQQVAGERARAEWSRRIPALLPTLRAVVEGFRGGMEECGGSSAVAVLVDVRRHDCPLVIAFNARQRQGEGVLSLRPGPAEPEAGASCQFRCEMDGIVYGFRYPFHPLTRDVRPERFVDLGEPGLLQPDQLGHAAADFLEWAAVGAGCGGRKMQFGLAPRAQEPFQLRVVAA